MRQFGLCLVAASLLAGCATVRPHVSRPAVPAPATASENEASGAASASLSAYMQELRGRSVHARPGYSDAERLEHRSPALAQALAEARVLPTAENHRRLAQAYLDAGIRDQALAYFERALEGGRHDAVAEDGVARIWRDWGLAAVALPHAQRAAAWAADSPVSQNTLGTVLWALGYASEARLHFQRALQLDPDGAYALNNLCYAWLMDAKTQAAAQACQAAIALMPDFAAARNNLALVRAQEGDTTGAEAEFLAAGSQAAAQFNLGIVHLAGRRFEAAAKAFERAALLQPGFTLAERRASSARRLALEAEGQGDADGRR